MENISSFAVFPREHPFKRLRRRRDRHNGILVALFVLCCTVRCLQAFVPTAGGRRIHVRSGISPERYNVVKMAAEAEQQQTLQQSPPFATSTASPSSSSSSRGPGWVSPEQLEELKESVDIVDVVESYGLDQFQRKSASSDSRAIAVCPFHNDRNPSLNIDGTRRLYKCFSCGAGGDVFNFVREYSKLQGEEMTFYQAVRHVGTEFGDGSIVGAAAGGSGSSRGPRLSDDERKAQQLKKERILLANAAAAAFYTECLTQPFGGPARSHLQARGLPAQAARTFALGYAPDAYYGQGRPRAAQWGDGSLVERLRELEFSPQEIFDAGLATRTKKSSDVRPLSSIEEPMQKPSTANATIEDALDYSTLMDRFRGRLVVPIFDATGKRVLGFGGRILGEAAQIASVSDFKAPKYLNSPESLVFQKKTVLFNENLARDAFRKGLGDKSPRGAIIVEGYMDAIALWGAGCKEVVASMGTALSSEQLASAAKLAGTPGGRVVLCLDNDEAGLTAVERLCGNGMLAETTKKHAVEIYVATLPDGLKDPADFIESRGGAKLDVAELFQSEVLDRASDWTDWYLERLFSEYDSAAMRGRPGSFSDIFERVAGFLATAMGPGDRTKRAYEVAGSLAGIIADESNATEVSSAVRFQLESDLIALASRVAEAKDAVQRRSESAGGQSPAGSRTVMSSLSRGQGPSTDDDDSEKMSSRALKSTSNSGSAAVSAGGEASERLQSTEPMPSGNKAARARAQSRRRTFREKNTPPKAKPLTPHFSGFKFERQSDMDWLGIPRENWKRKRSVLTLGSVTPMMAPRGKLGGKNQARAPTEDAVVYFNSNDYHGNQFLTNDAVDAGYTNRRTVKRDSSLVEKGVASLVEQDIEAMALTAEDSLLRVLVMHGAARTTAKNMLEARNAVNSGLGIEWSCAKKEWLFLSLVEDAEQIPPSCRTPEELRSFLADLPSAPAGALLGSDNAGNAFTVATPVVDEATDSDDAGHAIRSEDGFDSIDPKADFADGSVLPGTDAVTADAPGTDVSSVLVAGRESVVSAVPSLVQPSEESMLTQYFEPEDDHLAVTSNDAIADEIRSELFVQELLATLLWVTTSRRAGTIQQEFVDRYNALNQTSSSASVESGGDDSVSSLQEPTALTPTGGLVAISSLKKAELEPDLQRLATELRETTITLQQLQESSKRISSRLMDQGATDGLEGKVSLSLQEDLATRVDAHLFEVANSPQTVAVMSERDLLLLSGDDYDEEPYEDTLERMEEEWGEWWDEDFVWSPDRAGPSKAASNGLFEDSNSPNPMDALEQEDTFAEDMALMDEEWKKWEND